MAGKGDVPRPMQVDYRTFSDNFARTFGKTVPTLRGACGHTVPELPENPVYLAGLDAAGQKTVLHGRYCLPCQEQAKQDCRWLPDAETAERWLRGDYHLIGPL